MNLVASMIVRNELDRYLVPAISHLLGFCDEVRVVDDASDDGSYECLSRVPRVSVLRNDEPQFSENEGAARHALFEWTLEAKPTHILAIDADEFVSDGQKLRAALEDDPEVPVWTLLVCEVWLAEAENIWIRVDGQWAPARSPVLYKAPPRADRRWRIPPRRLASGREPSEVVRMAMAGETVALSVDLLHFGWANASERRARYERYAVADGGEFHSNDHLTSIVAPVGVTIQSIGWPEDVPRASLTSAAQSARVTA